MLRSFGAVAVPSAGTPVRLTDNIVGFDPVNGLRLQSIMVQALPANTGVVYVFCDGNTGGADHRTDLVGCVAILPAPADATEGPFPSASFSVPNAPAGLNLADFFIDVGQAGDGVIVSGTQQ